MIDSERTCCAIFSQFTRCSLTTFTTCSQSSHSLRCALPPKERTTYNICTPADTYLQTQVHERKARLLREPKVSARAKVEHVVRKHNAPQHRTADRTLLHLAQAGTHDRQRRQRRLAFRRTRRNDMKLTHLKVTAKLVPNRFHVTEYIGRSFGVEQRKLLRCTAAAYAKSDPNTLDRAH